MPKNYNDNDQDRGFFGSDDRDQRHRRDEIRPEWNRGYASNRNFEDRSGFDQRSQYDPSFHRNRNEGYDRSGYRSEDAWHLNDRSRYGFGGDVNSASWYPRNRASFAPADQRDNLNTGAWDQMNPTTEHGADMYSRSYSGRGPKGYKRSDERIKEDVCDVLEHNHRIDASEIEVDVKDGLVTLRGLIHDRAAKRLAEDLVENCRGVKDIRNELSIDQSFWQRAKEALLGPDKH